MKNTSYSQVSTSGARQGAGQSRPKIDPGFSPLSAIKPGGKKDAGATQKRIGYHKAN